MCVVFEAISGLNISDLIPMGEGMEVAPLASNLGCRVASLPSTYWGFLLGVLYKYEVGLELVVERFEKKLRVVGREGTFQKEVNLH